jgi:hypothetical protein
MHKKQIVHLDLLNDEDDDVEGSGVCLDEMSFAPQSSLYLAYN